jgi:hypothetical protein
MYQQASNIALVCPPVQIFWSVVRHSRRDRTGEQQPHSAEVFTNLDTVCSIDQKLQSHALEISKLLRFQVSL